MYNVSLKQNIHVCKLFYSVVRPGYNICSASWEWEFNADPFLHNSRFHGNSNISNLTDLWLSQNCLVSEVMVKHLLLLKIIFSISSMKIISNKATAELLSVSEQHKTEFSY